MTNVINTPAHIEVDVNKIDENLPFEGKTVWIWGIEKRMTGYGHWKLSLDIEVDGKKATLTKTTTDSLMVDFWDGVEEGEDHPQFLDEDYKGYEDAINECLSDNEDELLQLVAEEDEEEEN